jgi:hypothetical protein
LRFIKKGAFMLHPINSLKSFFWPERPKKVFDMTVQELAISILKTTAMTALITTTTLALGGISFLSLLFAPWSYQHGFSTAESLLIIANIANAIFSGVGLANKKKILSSIFGGATLIGCYALGGALLIESISFPVTIPLMLGIALISSCVTLLVKALKAEKLALKTIAAHAFVFTGIALSSIIAPQIYTGVLLGSAISAAIAAIATIGSVIAKKNGYITLSKIGAAIALLSSFVAALGVIAGVNDRARTIAFLGKEVPYWADAELIEIYKIGPHIQAKELGITTLAASAAITTIANQISSIFGKPEAKHLPLKSCGSAIVRFFQPKQNYFARLRFDWNHVSYDWKI